MMVSVAPMRLKIVQVDAFTDKPFAGNPAAVCVLPQPADERWMQTVAREMNLSDTAFLYRRDDGFDLRWFTPMAEVDLCGHATLASAHVLWEDGHLKASEQARFHTRSGLLTAERKGEWIELDFPATLEEPTAAPEGLLEALGVKPEYIGKNRYDFVSRFFGPAAGIDEDPVTGSAHCCLGPYWKKRLGKDQFVAYQASARGGVIRVRVGGKRVYLGGQAVTVLRGELLA